MKRILISGFTTFDTHSENSSQIITEMFNGYILEGYDFHTCVLPVAFSNAFELLKVEIDGFKPDYVLCLGLAGNRNQIDLEKVAINYIHSSIPDNEGIYRQDRPVEPQGPAAYFSTLPLSEMKGANTPFQVEISFSAGAYVCNYLMYKVLHYLNNTKVKAGFVHLPHLKENRYEVFDSLLCMIKVL